MKTTTAKPKPYQVPLSFRMACKAQHISPMRALQQFIDVITIKAFIGRDTSALAALACEFLRYCTRTADSKYHKEVHFSNYESSLIYLQEIEALQQADHKPAIKGKLINEKICDWHICIDSHKAIDFIYTTYHAKVTREFIMLCEALRLNSDYILFLYMCHVDITGEISPSRKKAAGICARFFTTASRTRKSLYKPMPQVLDCLYRRRSF